jgi:WD40 repeat protein
MNGQPIGFVAASPPMSFALLAQGHSVTALHWLPGGARLVSCGEHLDRVVRVWDVKEQKVLHTLGPHDRGITCAALLPGGKQLVTSDYGGDCRVWNLDTGAELKRFAHCDWTTGLAVSPDGRRVLTVGSHEGNGTAARLWDAATWAEVKKFPVPEGASEAPARVSARVAFLSDRRAVTGGWKDGSLLVWDVDAGTEVKRLTPPAPALAVHSLAVLPGGKRVLAGGEDGVVRLWDVDAGTVVKRWKLLAVCDAVAADPTGRFVAAGGRDNMVDVWDAETGDPVAQWPGTHMSALAFRADGRMLAAGSTNGAVRAWELLAPPP